MTQLRLTFALGALLSAGAFAQEFHQATAGPIGFAFQGATSCTCEPKAAWTTRS
jgi:hypothetical protein